MGGRPVFPRRLEHPCQKKQPKKTSGLAIAGLVLGILAAVTSFLPIINNLSFIMAIVGGILAAIALVGATRGKNDSKGLAIAGVVLAVVSFVIVLATQSLYSSALKSAAEELKKGDQPVATSTKDEKEDAKKDEATSKEDTKASTLPLTPSPRSRVHTATRRWYAQT